MQPLGGSGGDRLGARGALLGSGLELACLRSRPQAVPRRRRPVRGRAASGHRHRGGSERGRARTGCGCGRVRRNGSRQRTDGHPADRRRLFGHAPAPGLPGRARRHCARGEGRGRSGRARRCGSRRALRLPWSSTHRRAARICRSAVPASAPPDPRCRPRARTRACSRRAARRRRAAARASDARGSCAGAHDARRANALAAGAIPADASCARSREGVFPRRRSDTVTAPDGRPACRAASSRGPAAGHGAAAVDRTDHEGAFRSNPARFDRCARAPRREGARPREPEGERPRSRADLAPRPGPRRARLVRARNPWPAATGGEPGATQVARKRPP
jgi:hypothetical protein